MTGKVDPLAVLCASIAPRPGDQPAIVRDLSAEHRERCLAERSPRITVARDNRERHAFQITAPRGIFQMYGDHTVEITIIGKEDLAAFLGSIEMLCRQYQNKEPPA